MGNNKNEEIRENVTDISREEMGLIVDVLRENYNNARNFGLFKNEQSLEALEEGRGTKIMAGPWRGEPLELGHFISPEINDTIQPFDDRETARAILNAMGRTH